MLKWPDVLNLARDGNPAPDRKVVKTDAEWRQPRRAGTGWPSFTQPIKENVIAYRFDGPSFLKRIETVCNTCDAHLGHVFPDGPEPSGLRYCMNAVALKNVSKT